MTAEGAGASERERLAAVIFKSVLEDSSYAWVRASSDGTVAVDGDVDAGLIADAILAAGFGDVEQALEVASNAIRAHRVFYGKTGWTERDQEIFNRGLDVATGAVLRSQE